MAINTIENTYLVQVPKEANILQCHPISVPQEKELCGRLFPLRLSSYISNFRLPSVRVSDALCNLLFGSSPEANT